MTDPDRNLALRAQDKPALQVPNRGLKWGCTMVLLVCAIAPNFQIGRWAIDLVDSHSGMIGVF